MKEQIIQRLECISVLPESRAALMVAIQNDWDDIVSAGTWTRTQIFYGKLYHELGGSDPHHLQSFLTAWLVLRVAMRRLDYLQDRDPEISTMFDPASSEGERYNLVFSYYILAMAVLDHLLDQSLSLARNHRIHRLWNDSMLRAASGQQRDLVGATLRGAEMGNLDYYQQVAQAKSGAYYNLGFGGVATLATDDISVIQTVAYAGEVYGTLHQFCDDLVDASTQVNPALTLPQVYETASSAARLVLPTHPLHAYWSHLYEQYLAQVQQALDALPVGVQAAVLSPFRATFEQPLISEPTLQRQM